MATAHDNQYYTVPEAARMLRVSTTTVWRWIQAGKLHAYRVGPKSIRIKKEDLEDVIAPAQPRLREEMIAGQPHVARAVSAEELARRQALVDKILEASKERDISPLTSADLVHVARRQAMKKFAKHGK